MRVDGLRDLEGGKLAELDGAGAGGEEDVVGWCVGRCVGEDGLVRLRWLLGEGAEGVVGDSDGHERVVLCHICQSYILSIGRVLLVYLASHHDPAAVRAPDYRETFAAKLQRRDALLFNDVPELGGAIA